MVYKRKKYHYGDTHLKKRWRTKRRKKDLDQIDEDLKEDNAKDLLTQETDIDKPGQAQFYCVHCARYFINDQAMQEHFRTKVHKRRMKALELKPYSIEDSERAAGLGSFKQAQKRKIETQPSKDELEENPNTIKKLKSESISALFISGDKAHETFVVLTPHIDFEKQDIDKIEESIKLRGLKIDVNKIINNWIFFRKYQNQKLGLEEAKANIGKKIKSLNSEKDKAEIEKLIAHGKMIKNDLSIVKDYFYPVQETAYIKVLSLPNLLHPNTPLEPTIIHTFGNISKTQSDCHTEIGKNLIEFQSSSYYLKNEAALFELASTFYFTDKLLEKNFTQFSNSDFTRSVIVEGCGIDFSDPKQIFTIMETDLENKRENSRLHLSGGASLAAFLAYHTKHTVFPSLLPLKYFTIGRQYNPVNHNLKTNTLLNISQETAVEIFVATKDDTEEMNLEFGNVLKIVQEIYDSLGYHYQICYLPPKCLKKHESLHASIQMYSPFLQNYVEVGHLSICDDYISKRLLFNYGTGRNINFPRVLSGTLFSVPKILACVIENDDKSLINDSFKKYIS